MVVQAILDRLPSNNVKVLEADFAVGLINKKAYMGIYGRMDGSVKICQLQLLLFGLN